MPFAQKRMGFKKAPKLFLKNDSENAKNPLGQTAYYNPEEKSVTIYVSGRHPKDIMRSLSHELVHHCQNCRGDFSNSSDMGAGYAQNDKHLRKMEQEAYEKGNMCFRDWEDSIKSTIYYEHLQKGDNKMSIKDWKNKEISGLLAEAWGFKFNSLQEFNEFNEGADKNTGMSGVDGDDKDDTYMGHIKETGAKDDGESEGDKGKDKDDPKARDYTDGGDRKGDESKTHKGEKDDTTKKGDELKHSGKGRGEKKGDKAYVNEDSGGEEGHNYDDNRMSDDDHIKAIEHHLDALRHDRDYDDDHIDESARGRRRSASVDPTRDDERTRALEEDDIEEAGMMKTQARRKPRRVSARGQGTNSPTQDLRTTRREPEAEEDEEQDVAQVAERSMTKDQIREALRTVLASLSK